MSRTKPSRRAGPGLRNPGWWIGLLLLAAGIAAFALALASGAGTTTAVGTAREISVAEAAAQREAGAFLLDVREPEEWEAFHVPGATLIALGQLAARVNELPRDQEIIVVCRSGNRSQTGRDILLDAGFTQVSSMAGGLTEWRALGHPTVTGP